MPASQQDHCRTSTWSSCLLWLLPVICSTLSYNTAISSPSPALIEHITKLLKSACCLVGYIPGSECRIYRESARRPEQHATHSSPKVPSPPDTGSPAAGAGSRVGSEGPDRSSTLSMERRRRNQRDDDPEFVVGARAGSFRSAPLPCWFS